MLRESFDPLVGGDNPRRIEITAHGAADDQVGCGSVDYLDREILRQWQSRSQEIARHGHRILTIWPVLPVLLQIERARRAAEVPLEGAGEDVLRTISDHGGNRLPLRTRRSPGQRERALHAHPGGHRVHALPGQCGKDAMEMEGRQAGLAGEPLYREILIDVPIDQRERAVDPGFVAISVHAPSLPERVRGIHGRRSMFLAELCDGVPLRARMPLCRCIVR